MTIPERLRLQPVDKKIVKEMSALCDEIARELESGGTAEESLKQWHLRARVRYEPYSFLNYWRSVSKKTFVLDALNPRPAFDHEVIYSEALAVLTVVGKAECSESDQQYYVEWLDAQFPDSNMSDLIYWPDEWFGDASLFRDKNGVFKPEAELTNDQILGYAMAKSGRRVPGAPENISLPFPLPKKK